MILNSEKRNIITPLYLLPTGGPGGVYVDGGDGASGSYELVQVDLLSVCQ